MKRTLLLILSIVLTFSISQLWGQSASGIFQSDYSGINGAIINPANSTRHPLKWDLHLGGFHAFAHTDYAFVRETNLFHLIRNTADLRQFPINLAEDPFDPNAFYFDFDRTIDKKMGSGLLDVLGPGFLWQLDNWSVGVFSRFRGGGGTHSIPAVLSYQGIQTSRISVENDIPQSSNAQSLIWSEYGISLASSQLIPLEGLSLGINLKYIRGHQGGYVNATNEFNYIRNTTDSMILISPQVEFGLSGEAVNGSGSLTTNNGNSIGLDIGATYELPIGRVGLSILDIGAVRINNAEVYTLESSQTLELNTGAITDNISIREMVNELDNQLADQLDRITSLQSDSSFTVGLPTRVHLDFNYKWKKNISFVGAIDQRLPLFKNAIEAENVITLMPKYETKWWMISTPITIHEYQNVRVGLAARLGFLTIGTDHLMSLLGRRDFNGSSFYASLKVMPFGGSSRVKGNKRSKGKDVICPTPN